LFTDYYGQQSCTAGRAACITGQTPFRTGLLKVGLPAAKQGLQDSDPTIADILKPLGYATAQTIVGNLFSGKEDSTNVPLVTNLRVDPWERYQSESTSYGEWWGKKLWVMMPATMIMGNFLATFKDYPPSQISGSLGVEKALQALQVGCRKN